MYRSYALLTCQARGEGGLARRTLAPRPLCAKEGSVDGDVLPGRWTRSTTNS